MIMTQAKRVKFVSTYRCSLSLCIFRETFESVLWLLSMLTPMWRLFV